MLNIIVFALLGFILFMMFFIEHKFPAVFKNQSEHKDEEYFHHKVEISHGLIMAGIVGIIILMIAALYLMVKGTPYEGHIMEWLNIIMRVMHVTFGIAWIGASFYFVWLENALNRKEGVRDELAGNLWAIHGGGFYYLEKYKVAPQQVPKQLHWFKYEAYFTWLSGFCMLFIVYYFNAKAMLVDDTVLKLTSAQAIAIGVGSLAVGWILYDLLCKTPLVKTKWFAPVGFMLLIGFAWGYAHLFNSRAAYIHFGAMLGTIMVANVFFIIIPAQKAMVKAAKQGKIVNPELGKHAGLRSLHNNYFTLPVLFVMVSNHFPSTFGHQYSWAVLAAISLGAAGVKHYLNLKERGQYNIWVMPVSVLILLAAAFITAPPKPGACKENVGFAEVNVIINNRCLQCHSSKPTDDVYTAPPNGIVYDVPDNIVKLRDKIMQRVVITKTMPQNNKTGMTPEERDLIRCWIEQGAKTK
jgi:uncharacterized membrane protein